MRHVISEIKAIKKHLTKAIVRMLYYLCKHSYPTKTHSVKKKVFQFFSWYIFLPISWIIMRLKNKIVFFNFYFFPFLPHVLQSLVYNQNLWISHQILHCPKNCFFFPQTPQNPQILHQSLQIYIFFPWIPQNPQILH